jgi:glycosyltransferase involved in cell wall biosynthesis
MIPYDILIPAYNAEKTLPELIKSISILDHKPKKIYIVDDGSTDNTLQIAEKISCDLIVNKQNRGKGYSLKAGFSYFLKNSDSEYLICLDADLQHPPSKIPAFLEVIEKRHTEAVIGNRDKSFRKMPLSRILSNTITSWIISKITGQKIKDSQCGFRALKRDLLEQIDLKENGFQLESEFIFRVSELNKNIEFVDIPTLYNGQTSYISHYKDTVRFVRLIFREILKK